MWAARHEAHQPTAAHEATRREILDLPTGHLLDPVWQLGGSLRRSGGSARFEDQRDRGRGSIAPWDQVVDRYVAQLTEQVREPAEVVEGLDIGQRVEVQVLRRPQPERASGVLAEVPCDRRAQECDRIVDELSSRNVQQREVDTGHDTILSPSSGHIWHTSREKACVNFLFGRRLPLLVLSAGEFGEHRVVGREVGLVVAVGGAIEPLGGALVAASPLDQQRDHHDNER